jgi:hypothetical protein
MVGPLSIIRAAASGLKGLVAPQNNPSKDAVDVIAATATITVIDPNATKASEALAKAVVGSTFIELPAAPAKTLSAPAAHSAELKAELKEETKTEAKADIKPEVAVKEDLKAKPEPAEQLGGDVESKATGVSCSASCATAAQACRVMWSVSHKGAELLVTASS